MLPSVSPQYVHDGGVFTLECAVNDMISDHATIEVQMWNQNNMVRKSVIINSPTARNSSLHQSEESTIVENNRFIFTMNGTTEASGFYYCIYEAGFETRLFSNTIRIIVKGKLHSHI